MLTSRKCSSFEKRRRSNCRLCSAGFMLLSMFLVGRSNIALASESPFPQIPHLESSLTASAAQGTTIAVSSRLDNDEPCCILLSRAPQPPASDEHMPEACEESNSVHTSTLTLGGLDVIEKESHQINQGNSKKWTLLGDSALVTMTGFVPDVQHVTRVVLKSVESYSSLYSTAVPPSKLVRYVSNYMDRACRVKGGRPLGVQALLVICEAAAAPTEAKEGNNSAPSLLLYTVDPTGGWRNHAGRLPFAVVGRNGIEIHKHMITEGGFENVESPRDALKMAMSSMLSPLQLDSQHQDDVAKYDALLVYTTSQQQHVSSIQTARIHPKAVVECHDGVVQDMIAKTATES